MLEEGLGLAPGAGLPLLAAAPGLLYDVTGDTLAARLADLEALFGAGRDQVVTLVTAQPVRGWVGVVCMVGGWDTAVGGGRWGKGSREGF